MIVCTFDTETTGLLRNPMARIVEIGIVKHDIETGKVYDTLEFFVKPSDNIMPFQDFKIPQQFCGISKEEILEGCDYITAIRKFCNFVGNNLVYAWNLPFDQRMMMRFVDDAIHSEGDIVSALSWMQKIRWGGCWQHLYAFSNVSNGNAIRFDDGQLKTISMRETIKLEGWEAEQQHRALSDALLAAKIGHKLFKQLNK